MIQESPSRRVLGVLLVLTFTAGCVPFSVTAMPTADTQPMMTPTLKPTAAATVTQLPIPSQTPSPPAPMVHDPETRTGIGDVDRIIDVVLGGSADRIREVLVFTATGCTHADGLGGPPKCREGESEGALVEVLPFLGPEGHFLRRDELDEWPGIEVAGLYAVYRVSKDAYSNENYPAGQFAIVFIDARGLPGVALQVDRGGIVRIDHLFGDSLETVLERDAEEVILPPPT